MDSAIGFRLYFGDTFRSLVLSEHEFSHGTKLSLTLTDFVDGDFFESQVLEGGDFFVGAEAGFPEERVDGFFEGGGGFEGSCEGSSCLFGLLWGFIDGEVDMVGLKLVAVQTGARGSGTSLLAFTRGCHFVISVFVSS